MSNGFYTLVMSQPAAVFDRITESEYLEFEKTSAVRHEFIDGWLHAMAGESKRHNLVALNIVVALRSKAREKNCQMFMENVKVRADEGSKYYYPDIVLTCNPGSDTGYIAENPCFIVEIRSPSTETTDLREKLEIYTKIPSLKTYLIVSQSERKVLAYQLLEGDWARTTLENQGFARVPCLETKLTLEEIYEGIVFED
jgi:Uma2 family endonuclease